MTKEEILDKAKEIVTGDRQNAYGEVEDNFGRIARLWTEYLNEGNTSIELDAEDVACMMILLKIARIKSGHHKDDNWIDIAGYSACGGER